MSVISDCIYGSVALNCTDTGPVVPVIENEVSNSDARPTELAAPVALGMFTLAEVDAVREIESAEPLPFAHVTNALELAVAPLSEFETSSPKLFCA